MKARRLTREYRAYGFWRPFRTDIEPAPHRFSITLTPWKVDRVNEEKIGRKGEKKRPIPNDNNEQGMGGGGSQNKPSYNSAGSNYT